MADSAQLDASSDPGINGRLLQAREEFHQRLSAITNDLLSQSAEVFASLLSTPIVCPPRVYLVLTLGDPPCWLTRTTLATRLATKIGAALRGYLCACFCAFIFCVAGVLIERKVVLPSAAVAVRAVLQPV